MYIDLFYKQFKTFKNILQCEEENVKTCLF